MRALVSGLLLSLALAAPAAAKPKLYIAFQWHMHQPIYWPYESVVQTNDANRWDFSVLTTHFDRSGPYSAWPVDAVQAGSGLPHLGAQVSFTGSLIENLGAIEHAGRGFSGWKNRWSSSRSWTTSNGNPRLDLVAIGYHHPLMPLIPEADRRLHIAMHKRALERAFGAPAKPVKGMFPPETAFAEHIVPALAAEGIQWAFVDNIHFDRARPDYPWSSGSNLPPPNGADQRNTGGNVTWVQLNGIWAGSKVGAPWGYQPHWVEYTDPATGASTKVIAVPAARYEGNEDARGGFGALQYEAVLSQYEALNTDDAHPMLVVLHHDGDNYGGGTESYYHGNFSAFLAWVQSKSDRFEATTVQDYLDRFPPASDDVIHVEPGSWSGADNGDPQFLKWNGNPGADGYSPDRHSWSVIVAAAHRVHAAEAKQPHTSVDAIIDGGGNDTDKAWHHLLNGETSCYWYWDGSAGGKWDSHPARAANLAMTYADRVLAGGGADTTAPELYLPQRDPWNPGGKQGSTTLPSDFDVWTLAYDAAGVAAVTLHVRADGDGQVDRANKLYAGSWSEIAMTERATVSRSDPAPVYRAAEYRATVTGLHDTLVDYYVSARDPAGNTARTPIQHVRVGESGGSSTSCGSASVGWEPCRPARTQTVKIWGTKAGRLHWGVDGWNAPPAALQPAGTDPFDAKAVETPLAGPDAQGRYSLVLGPVGESVDVLDFVMHWSDNTWDNNGGADYHVRFVDEVPDAGTPGADAGTTGGADGGPGDERKDEPQGCGCGGTAGVIGLAALAMLLRKKR